MILSQVCKKRLSRLVSLHALQKVGASAERRNRESEFLVQIDRVHLTLI